MTRPIDRRAFCRHLGGSVVAAGLGPALLPGSARAEQPERAEGPKVVIVRFGGGVRRLETIARGHRTFAPHLVNDLLPRGTLWENVEMEPRTTSHTLGTINLLTGSWFPDPMPRGGAEEVVPHAPTLFELARKDLGLPQHEVLVCNNYIHSEQLGFSEHPDFGEDHQPGLLSYYELERTAIDRRLAEPGLTDRDRQRLEDERAQLLFRHYRADARPPEPLLAYFEEHRARYGSHYARGDRLVRDLALASLERFRPRLLAVNFNDTDYVHTGISYFYTRGIQAIDRYTRDIHQALRRDPFYRDDTYLFVVADCGRGTNPRRYMPYQHHEPHEAGSHEVFVYATGPGVGRGTRVDRLRLQVDLAPTVGHLLGVRSAAWEGELLGELLA